MGASQPVYSKTVLLTRRPTTRRRAKMPLITVVMPVYNGEAFVGQAVESILSQTFNDFEFVIVDDGSTDRTGEILRSYVDPRVRVLEQEHAGLISSLNRAISLASGQYIARMDADDVSLPRRLELQAERLRNSPSLAALGTQALQIDESGEKIRRHYYPTGGKAIETALFRGATAFCHGSMMFSRACWEAAGGYRQTFEHAEDYDLWLRIIESYAMDNLPDLLYLKRLSLRSVSFEHFLTQQRNAAHALDCARRRKAGLPEGERTRASSPPTARELADYHWHLGLAQADLGHIGKARVEFRFAISHRSTDPHIWLSYLFTLLGTSLSRRAFLVARRAAFLVPGLQKDSLAPFRG
jgi:hypothetical protein